MLTPVMFEVDTSIMGLIDPARNARDVAFSYTPVTFADLHMLVMFVRSFVPTMPTS